MIRERPLEKSLCHDLPHRIMIRPHGAVLPTRMGIVEILTELSKAICLLIIYSYSNKIYLLILFRCVIIVLLDECILLLSQMKGVLIVISDTQNAQSPTKNKKTYTVEEIAEQLDISKKVAYSLVKSGQFSYVRAGKAIRVSKVSFDKWLNGI